MRFDISLLAPTLRLSCAMAAAMPATLIVGWIGVAALGLLAGIASEQSYASGAAIWAAHMLALALVQLWVGGEALERAGCRPRLSFGGLLILVLQNLMVTLAILLGLLVLVLPALYVAARFYLAGSLLIQEGKDAGATMWRSWDLLERHWPTTLILVLMFASLWAFRLLIVYHSPYVAADWAFVANFGLNLLSSLGIIGGYVTAAALLIKVDPPPSVYEEIFG